ncbi:BTB/POZ domain-containing protein At3g49900-like [Neltuma alba]|uniref:BTB/POZ domain-containing protein At3g49900-like n=1 Tax=Neltuma alba TaxID=207710 RepID=UPI0010A2FF45|nr:BTB/POZ domain-containing protein At3g49900-like [Prosopis alba]
MQVRNWGNLGVVETIYEEECEFSSSTSPSVSPSLLSPYTPLHSRVEAWSLATGRETDILVRVRGSCFRLHKERLTSRSSYLKRHLTEVVSDFTLSPPLNITADTFTSIAEFCYSSDVQVTPSNVAALRTAAELLGMTEAKGIEEENLGHVTEAYFRGVITINQEYASMVLRSCLPLLPESETSAFLVSRCIEALILADGGHIEDDTCLNDVVAMHPQDFLVVAESMCRRFRNHDVLYKIADLYLKENKFGKIAEEQKAEICNCIDCTKLSPRTLVECVQNPRMPLRFIIRAMLVEQLNTRNSIVSAAAVSHLHTATAAAATVTAHRHHRSELPEGGNSTTLGEYLHREAVIRHSAHLRAAMESTSSRIQSLEKELRGMKQILLESTQADQPERRSKVLNSERPKSFHYVPFENGNKIERGERGSVSSSSFRFDSRIMGIPEVERSTCLYEESSEFNNGTPKVNKTFRQRLIKGLKNAFRVSTSASSN